MPDGLDGPPRIIFRVEGQALMAEGQCDACSATVAVTQPHLPAGSRYVLSAPIGLELDAGHLAVGGPQLRGGVLVLNRSALMLARHFDHPHRLSSASAAFRRVWGESAVQEALSQMVSLGLIMPYGCTAPAPIERPQTLAAWLHLTNACQLACDYCYRSRSSAEMSPEVGRLAVDAVFRSALAHGFTTVKLKYAGGEPTLRFPLLVELHHHAAGTATRHGLELDGVVISNGVGLTPRMIDTVQALGLRLVLSLDGVGGYHDRQRHFADGSGSFDMVAHSIDLALACGLVPNISVTVTGHNAAGLPELMGWLLERNLPFGLSFYREHARAVPSDLRLEEESVIEGLLAAYRVIEKHLPQRSLLAVLADRANLATPHLRPCGIGINYVVIDPAGRVAGCQLDLGHALTDVHDPDPLARVREGYKDLYNPPVDEKAGCAECQWRYWCCGGCPLEAHRVTINRDARSPNCDIYRALFPEMMRLEGLRLLRYGDSIPERGLGHAAASPSQSRSAAR